MQAFCSDSQYVTVSDWRACSFSSEWPSMELYGIFKEEFDDKNPEHIKTIFKSITDKDWNKIKVDLNNIWMNEFNYFTISTSAFDILS